MIQESDPVIPSSIHLSAELKMMPATRLVLLCAPTGYGKSTVATYWFHKWQQQRFYLNLTLGDNFLEHFIQHLSGVLGLQEPQVSHVSEASLCSALISQLRDWQKNKRILLILDGLQLLENQVIFQLLKQVLQMTQFNIVLCSRFHHNKLLTPFKLQSELTVIESRQLSLDIDQIKSLFSECKKMPDEQWFVHHNQYLHGWPAPWKMLQQLVVDDSFDTLNLKALTLKELNAGIAEYLISETLEALPTELKELLYSLVAFERFTVAMAEETCATPNFNSKLQELLQRQLFLYRDPQSSEYFLFVPFFREALQHYLVLNDSQRLDVAIQRSFKTLMKQQRWQDAASLVLRYKSPTLAEKWLHQAGWKSFHLAYYQQLQQLFFLLSAGTIKADVELAILYSWFLLEGKKDSKAASVYIEELDTTQWKPIEQARVDTLMAEISYQFDDLDNACRYASKALQLVKDPHECSSAAFTLAMSLLWQGKIAEAELQLQVLSPKANTLKQFHIALAIEFRKANIAQLRGDFRQERLQIKRAENKAQQLNLLNDHLNDAIFRGKTEAYLSFGEFEQAKKSLAKGVTLEKPLEDYWWISYNSLQLVLDLFAGKTINKQIEQLEQRLSQQLICRQWSYRVKGTLQLCYRWQNNAYKLQQLEKQLIWHQQISNVYDIQDNLLFARNQIFLSKKLPDGLLQQSLAWRKLGLLHLADQAQWLMLYQRWQHCVSSEQNNELIATILKQTQHWLTMGYLKDFLWVGPQGLILWQQLLPHVSESKAQLASLDQLIELCTQTASADNKRQHSPDPRLTNKEWQVLSAIAQGYSNKQIAAQMYVALSTVKSHVNNLYSKLSISNRAQAKALALSLSLNVD